ncbi:hypothetical protein HDU99_004299, partial [Rhizoclosmatium hyalinum]
TIKTVVAFGGSHSDNGNFFKDPNLGNSKFPPSPPYSTGRFSNGETWVEQLAKMLNKANLIDYAYIGSCANAANAAGSFVPGTKVDATSVPDIAKQYEKFQTDIKAENRDAATTLYTVFAGPEDLLYALRQGKAPNVADIAGISY